MNKKKKIILKNILSIFAVPIFGFILLNLTFILDAVFQGLIELFVRIFVEFDENTSWYWFPPLRHGLFIVLIALISWVIFKSKLKTIYKAIYLPVPAAVIFVTIGMFLYQWPVITYSLSSLFGIGVLFYLYRTKKPWLYYYAFSLIGITMLMVGILGVEI